MGSYAASSHAVIIAPTMAAAISASRIPWRVARMPARCAMRGGGARLGAAARSPASSWASAGRSWRRPEPRRAVPSRSCVPCRALTRLPSNGESHAAVASSFGETVATSPLMARRRSSSSLQRANLDPEIGAETHPGRARGRARARPSGSGGGAKSVRLGVGREAALPPGWIGPPDRENGCRRETGRRWPGSS